MFRNRIGLAIHIFAIFINIEVCSTAILWECSDWDTDDILGGCNWGTSHIVHGSEGLAVVEDPSGESSQNALRVFYPNGSRAGVVPKGGVEWLGRPFAGQDRATLEYELYLASNFEYVKGGKLPGLFGGNGTCAGGISSPSCFSTRHMWRREGAGEIYGYIPNEKDDWFCDNPDVVCNFEKGHSFGRGSFTFVKGKWQKISQYIQLNDQGDTNGLMRIFVDGSQVYEISGLTFRNDSSLKIDAIFFSTFFGGSDDTWASATDTYAYFRNFKVEA